MNINLRYSSFVYIGIRNLNNTVEAVNFLLSDIKWMPAAPYGIVVSLSYWIVRTFLIE